jgi:ribose transport system substrate-binding protein
VLRTTVRWMTHARRRRRACASLVLVAGVSVLLGACGSSNDSGASSAGSGSKLIVLELPFPCGLNNFAKDMCDGAKAAAKNFPAGYSLQVKTAPNYDDQQAFNSLIQTSLQLKPAGLLVFANGAAAQTPFLNQGCEQGVKVIFVDTAGSGVECEISFVTAPNKEMGAAAAKYLIEHPAPGGSRKVIVVSQQPGLFNSNDERVAGFKETIESAGYKVVQTVVTSNDVTKTRTAVTNAVTAHPDTEAVFSANGPMGNGTEQALQKNPDIIQLTMDGNATDIPSILKGKVAANVAQSPYEDSKVAAELMVKALEGEPVPKDVGTPIKVIDKSNAQAYLDAGGSLRAE